MNALRQYTAITADFLVKHTKGKSIENFIIEPYPKELYIY